MLSLSNETDFSNETGSSKLPDDFACWNKNICWEHDYSTKTLLFQGFHTVICHIQISFSGVTQLLLLLLFFLSNVILCSFEEHKLIFLKGLNFSFLSSLVWEP